MIAERISTLLSHYWTADDPPEVRALQIGDWLDDLAEFPAPIVAMACAAWRQSERRRPLAVDLRTLCIAEQMKHAPKRQAPLQVTDMHREVMPAPDVVRSGWRKIPHSLLTAAERTLFADSGAQARIEVLVAIARSAPVMPLAAHEDRRPLPKIGGHALLAEDDPAVQAALARMS